MTYTKTISITDMKIATRLNEEENASGLITELLRKHYENANLKKLPLSKIQQLQELAKIQETIDRQESEILNNAS
jgi:hypothetical protein